MTGIRYTDDYIPERLALKIAEELEAVHRKYGHAQQHDQQGWLGILTKQLGDLYISINIRKESLPEGEVEKQVYQIVAACIEWLKSETLVDMKAEEIREDRSVIPHEDVSA